MLVLSTNLASLQARTALEHTQDGMGTALQRLSSGLRVNSARDDAAGLSVATRLDAQRRGTIVGARNANDGISLMQVGDQALASMGEGLQRMRELAVQSLDSPLSDADRAALDAELQQRLAEVDRTAAGTRFNGRALLDGSFGQATFQIGSGSGDTVGVDLSTNVRTDHLGAIATATSADLRTSGGGFQFAGTYTTAAIGSLDFSRPTVPFTPGWTATAGAPPTNYTGAGNTTQFTVDGHPVTLNASYGSNGALANAVQAQLDASASGQYVVGFDAGGHLRFTKTAIAWAAPTAPSVVGQGGNFASAFDNASATDGTAYSPTTNAGFDVDGHTVSLTGNYADGSALVADLQSQLDHAAAGAYRVSGGTAGISIAHTGDQVLPQLNHFTGAGAAVFGQRQANGLTLRAGDLSVQVGTAKAVDVTGTFNTPDDLARAVTAQVPDVVAAIDAASGTLQISARDTLTLAGSQSGAGGAVGFSPLVNPPSGNLAHIDVRSATAARDAVLRIDAAIDQVSSQRSAFGADQARFEAISSQATRDADIVATARGRIVDADMAVESASWARSQVLRKAGLAMVAQANQSARGVLALLG